MELSFYNATGFRSTRQTGPLSRVTARSAWLTCQCADPDGDEALRRRGWEGDKEVAGVAGRLTFVVKGGEECDAFSGR